MNEEQLKKIMDAISKLKVKIGMFETTVVTSDNLCLIEAVLRENCLSNDLSETKSYYVIRFIDKSDCEKIRYVDAIKSYIFDTCETPESAKHFSNKELALDVAKDLKIEKLKRPNYSFDPEDYFCVQKVVRNIYDVYDLEEVNEE